jgi:signal transduction histidine kinase
LAKPAVDTVSTEHIEHREPLRSLQSRLSRLDLATRLVVAVAVPAAVVLLALVVVRSAGLPAPWAWFIVAATAAAGIAMAAAYVRRELSPLYDLQRVAVRLIDGELDARPVLPGTPELAAVATALDQLAGELQASHEELGIRAPARTRLLEQLINAQEEERKRIARELHDGVGQALLSLMVGLKLIANIDSLDDAHAKAEDLRGVVSESLEQVRSLSRELRPSVLDDLGLAVALDRYVKEFAGRHPSIAVDLHCDLTDRVPSVVETALYRIVQEAMTNAARHGQCNTIGVLLSRRDRAVQAIVEDDGVGFDVDAARESGTSVGIHGMVERAELVGGEIVIESGVGGTTVFVEVPV